ncbi:MAG: MFS transporter [Acidobacteria bacterium]|nr:MFS transporter [Acidobacteriota bacterium]
MSLWRNREFLKLWAGQTISEIGSRITRDGLPWTAVAVLGATPAQMGMVSALGGIATLVAGPAAGWVADRVRLKPVLALADIGRAVALAVVPLAAWQGWLSLPLLYMVVSATGLMTVFFDVAYQSVLPSMVKKGELLEGNSKLMMTASTAEIVGPAMTGFLIQLLTAPRAILFDSISFLISSASILWMRVPDRKVKPADEPAGWREMFAGMPYMWRHPILRPLALRSATSSFSFGFFMALYTLFAVRELGLTAAVLGMLVSLGGISSFFGANIVQKLLERVTVGQALIGSTVVSGLLVLVIPLGRGPFWGAVCLGASQLLGDLSFPIYHITELALRQKVSEPHMLGRVNGGMQMLFKGVLPIGALVGGGVATWLGVREAFFMAGTGVLLSSLWLFFSPVRRIQKV